MNKKTLIFLTDRFEAAWIKKIFGCLNQSQLDVEIGSFGKAERIVSKEGGFHLESSISFKEAEQTDWDLVVVADTETAYAIQGDATAVSILANAKKNGKLILSIGQGNRLLIDTGVVQGLKLASVDPDLDAKLANIGAMIVQDNIVKDGNVITANDSASSGDLCRILNESLQT